MIVNTAIFRLSSLSQFCSMRNKLLALGFVTITFFSAQSAIAQANIGCMDKSIRLQSEQIKTNFKQQGLTVFKDAMISMESKQPFPVAVQLNKGILYQLVFIGNRQASGLTFELFDGKDNKIGEQSADDPNKNNYIIYSFVPEKTDLYLIVLTQKIKQKSVCSSFSILEKGDGKAQTTQPSAAPANSKDKYSNDSPYPLKRGKNIEKK